MFTQVCNKMYDWLVVLAIAFVTLVVPTLIEQM